jgi:hypothetical protein
MTKICPQCKEDKNIELHYAWNNKAHTRRKSWCRTCLAKKQREIYATKNGKNHVDNVVNKSKINIREKNWYKINLYLQENSCVDCGFKDIRTLQFDHVKGEKVDSVSAMIRRKFSWEKLEQEINKCEVRCANCHQIKTAKQLNYKNPKFK